MIKDATGRELKIGQLVELPWVGMVRATVVNTIEAPRVLSPGQQPFPPRIILQILLEQPADMQGQMPHLYIIKEPPTQEQLDEARKLVDGGTPS